MGREVKTFIDPRLKSVAGNVIMKVGEDIEAELVKKGFLTEEGNPAGGATEEGLTALIKGIATGIVTAFIHARIYFPEGSVPDEVSLTDDLLEGQGKPRVRTLGNCIGIRFDGQRPLLKSLVAPLDLDKSIDSKNGDQIRGRVKNHSFFGSEIEFPRGKQNQRKVM